MRTFLVAAAAIATLVYARLFGGPMDGTAWNVKVKADSLFAFPHRDTLTFEKGRLKTADYPAPGFAPGVYQAQTAQGQDTTVFNASMTNAEKGVLSWHGLIKGDFIEGIVVWWTKNGGLKKYTFNGSRKNN